MKNILIILALFTVLFTSCEKEENIITESPKVDMTNTIVYYNDLMRDTIFVDSIGYFSIYGLHIFYNEEVEIGVNFYNGNFRSIIYIFPFNLGETINGPDINGGVISVIADGYDYQGTIQDTCAIFKVKCETINIKDNKFYFEFNINTLN